MLILAHYIIQVFRLVVHYTPYLREQINVRLIVCLTTNGLLSSTTPWLTVEFFFPELVIKPPVRPADYQ